LYLLYYIESLLTTILTQGEILGEYRLGISDSWYALRIDKMIEENKLIVVENKDTSHPYGKVLRKV
jgi:hypothetical protein